MLTHSLRGTPSDGSVSIPWLLLLSTIVRDQTLKRRGVCGHMLPWVPAASGRVSEASPGIRAVTPHSSGSEAICSQPPTRHSSPRRPLRAGWPSRVVIISLSAERQQPGLACPRQLALDVTADTAVAVGPLCSAPQAFLLRFGDVKQSAVVTFWDKARWIPKTEPETCYCGEIQAM